MSNPLPLALLFGSWHTFFDANGAPLANGSLTFSVAGGTTPQNVYADWQANTSLGNVVSLNAAGQPQTSSNAPTGIFILPTGYHLSIADRNGNPVNTQDGIEDVGSAYLSTLGQQFVVGSKGVTCPYTILSTDLLITVTTGGVVNLPPAAQRGLPIGIMNFDTVNQVAVTPNGAETINGFASPAPVAVSTPGYQNVKWFLSDGVSNWYLAYAW